MLAYVFWHRPGGDEAPAAYEARLTAFHAALAEHPPEGFAGSAALRVQEAPWLPGGGPAYEDWYAVEGWDALGALNEAAVRGARAQPHDAVAARTRAGAAPSTGSSTARRSSPPRARAGSPSRPARTATPSTRSSPGRGARCGCGRWCSGRRPSTPCARARRSCSLRGPGDRRHAAVSEQEALAALDPGALARDAAAALRVPSVTGCERGVLEHLAATAERLGLVPDLHEHDLAALRATPATRARRRRARSCGG